MPFIIFLITAAFMSLLLDRTPFGIQLYLLGSNPTLLFFPGSIIGGLFSGVSPL